MVGEIILGMVGEIKIGIPGRDHRNPHVKLDPSSGVHFMTVVEDDETGRTVKTENSLRAIPLHPELLRIGFLKFVDHRRKADGPEERLNKGRQLPAEVVEGRASPKGNSR